jgi:hypothetical protein
MHLRIDKAKPFDSVQHWFKFVQVSFRYSLHTKKHNVFEKRNLFVESFVELQSLNNLMKCIILALDI